MCICMYAVVTDWYIRMTLHVYIHDGYTLEGWYYVHDSHSLEGWYV